MKNKLLIITRHQQEFGERVAKLNLPDLEIYYPLTDGEIQKLIPTANIILANPTLIKPLLKSANNLDWMQSTFTGIDALMDPKLKRNYRLTNVRGVFGEIIAEYVFTYIFYFEKEVAQFLENQRSKLWIEKESRSLRGRTIGVLGTGSIGQEIARVAKVFGMSTVGYRRTLEVVENFDRICTHNNISEFFGSCDYVVSALPATPLTKGIIGRAAFDAMKSDAILLNVGRGSAVVTDDLINALDNGKIRAAVLDVFEEEPLPNDNPLWTTRNLIVTPHISGYLNSDKIFEIFADNYMRFQKSDPLKYQVNFEDGY